MENNVIYLSDASFDPYTKEAGIGIKNLYTNQNYALCVQARNVLEAEEFALIEAIEHALEHQHRNCVFVYDNIGIDTKGLGVFFGSLFDRIQFLWMKRDYLKQVDRLARNIRRKHSKNDSLTKQIISYSKISDEELVSVLMPLTRGDTYGYLCALSGSAPMYKTIPQGVKEINAKVIALLFDVGSKALKERLLERYLNIRSYKHKVYDELIKVSGFEMSWFDEAVYEYRIQEQITDIGGDYVEKNVGHIMEDSSNIKEIKDREIQERTDEDDNDSQR